MKKKTIKLKANILIYYSHAKILFKKTIFSFLLNKSTDIFGWFYFKELN